jgi:hypothetical protein
VTIPRSVEGTANRITEAATAAVREGEPAARPGRSDPSVNATADTESDAPARIQNSHEVERKRSARRPPRKLPSAMNASMTPIRLVHTKMELPK